MKTALVATLFAVAATAATAQLSSPISPGAGPTVLVWTHYEQTAAVHERLMAEGDGWASVIRVPFEAQGADVRAM